MAGDIFVFEIDGARYGVLTASVASIAETERLPFVPGQSGIVCGVISLRGEPVAVVDAGTALGGAAAGSAAGQGKVVIVKDRGRSLGLFIGKSRTYFLWEEELKGAEAKGAEGRYLSGEIVTGDGAIRLIDWAALFDEAARDLSTEKER